MDAITAGAMQIAMNLAAFARGPSVFTATISEVKILEGKILAVDVYPTSPLVARSAQQEVVDLGLGYGQAAASGSQDAQCTATIALQGTTSYLHSTSMATVTPGSAICACSLIAISPLP
jgi:hypothetical protein